ncbi:hypothetical protein V6N12_070863 [Hibiscus sabdariffa]|uniref:Uncharacterized protein n=1 Tax=Hibiscus sabdariffa TaxID=183260 RepID=A0ABR2FI38_9ROSI
MKLSIVESVMEEGKLNLNAPLLSVRRLSSPHSFSATDEQKLLENSSYTRADILPSINSDVSLDQVTEPVAVPFVWEQIPGKAKGGTENEFQPNKEASIIPKLPPGRVSHVIKYPGERDVGNQYVLMPQCSMNNNVSELDCTNEGMNGKCISEFEEEEDVYPDALDTLSPTDSFSTNCTTSMSGSVAKPSGSFSTHQRMSRFLPAAMGTTLKTPPYASRKRSLAPDQPREDKKVASRRREALVNRYDSIIIPRYNHREYKVYKDSGNLSRKICGLLPRLCFINYVCLFIPVPRLKVRTSSSISCTREVAKPGKATSIKSHSQIVETHAWDVWNNRSDSRVQPFRLPENRSDNKVQSPRLLEDKSDTGVESHRLPEIGEMLSCGSSQFSSSDDLQMVTWLAPERPTGSVRIPPYRRERPQSPFSGGGFLGMPKEAEKLKPHMLVKHTDSSNSSLELVPDQSPAVEKTLYADTVEIGNPISNSSYTIVMNRMLEEPACVESSLQDIKGLNLLHREGISENEVTGSTNLSRSDKPYLRGQADHGNSKGGSDYGPLPPPLPKTPSESWLSRALPAVTSRNSFSKSHNATRFNPNKRDPKVPATGTKWETIVKSCYFHHHRVRYSEELVTHLSQQSKS